MDKETKKKIRSEIDHSTIPDEMKVLYQMAAATSLMCEQIDNRIRAIFAKNGFYSRPNDLLSGITDYCKAAKTASFLFSQRIEPQIIGATIGVGGTKSYDWFNSDSNELCQLVLLYIDRCARDNDNYNKIIDFFLSLTSGEIFKEEDINKYVLGG